MPLLEAAFRLYGWQDEDEAAEALGNDAGAGAAWRRGTERMDVADYMALTTIVNVGLADAMKSGKAAIADISAPPRRSACDPLASVEVGAV